MLPIPYNDARLSTLNTANAPIESVGQYPNAPELAVTANDLSLEARFLYMGVSPSDLYHHVTHISRCLSAVVKLSQNYQEFPVDVQQIINNFNREQPEGRPTIQSIDEFFALVTQATIYHDIGNIFYLDDFYKTNYLLNDLAHLLMEHTAPGPEAIQANKPLLSIVQFAEKLDELNGLDEKMGILGQNKPIKQLKELHNEEGAEYRSTDILLFSIKYSLATQYRVEAGLPGANTEQIAKKYQRLYDLSVDFVSKFIAETFYSPVESYTNALSVVAKWVDRVSPYYGLELPDLITIIKSLAREKVEESRGHTPQVSLRGCFNYPFLELIKICNGDKDLLLQLIRAGPKIGIGKLLRVGSNSFKSLSSEDWTKKRSWEDVLKFLELKQVA